MTDFEHQIGIIKIGTDVVTTPEGALDEDSIENLVNQIADIRRAFRNVLVVSSGAVAAGRDVYKQAGRQMPAIDDETPAQKQKYAGLGQSRLNQVYERFLDRHGLLFDQTLVTKHTFDCPDHLEHFLQGMDETLSDRDIIPVINENDRVCTDELLHTDNDQATGRLATLLRADVVTLLTSKNGVLRDLKKDDSNIEVVERGSDAWKEFVTEESNGNGRGGMWNKCLEAQAMAENGIRTHIASGREERILQKILLENRARGTKFDI